MIIEELYLSGWKSYSEQGVELKDLKKINLLIGPNNVGKSNILKYFMFLRGIFPEGNDTFEKVDLSHKMLDREDRWLHRDNPVKCKMSIVDCPPHEFFKDSVPERINLQSIHQSNEKLSEFTITDQNNLNEIQANIFWRHFISNHVRFIGDVRGFVHNTAGNLDIHIDGTKILDFLLEKVKSDIQWIVQYEEKMSMWLKNILNEEELIFKFISDVKTDFQIMVQRGFEKETIVFRPRELGTGIAHLVLILTMLHACSHRKMNIFLEEPEMNLHSQSVIALTKILKEEFPNHRYFIFTHSNVWIDQVDKDYSIYSFYKNTDNSTQCRNCTEYKDFYRIFDGIGIRPSQLLLSNFNIWIEGPSDRIYINYWINKFSRGTLFEGRHYNFVMYGGTNLSHYDVVFDDVINILSTGYNTAIICDSDISNKRDTIKDRVIKIQRRIEEEHLEEHAMLWITAGREIENYIPEALFEKVLRNDFFKKSYILHGNKQIELLQSCKTSGMEYKPIDSFDDYFVYLYDFDKNKIMNQFKDSITNKEEFSDLMKKLEQKKNKVLKNISKVEIAKHIVLEWENYGEYESYDLQSKMIEMTERIRKSNGMY